MEEIKRRRAVIVDHLNGKYTTGRPITDVEFLFLQYRKMLELIALSTLCANRTQYEKVRASFKKEWSATRSFKTLKRINPNFYPKPSEQIVDKETGKPTMEMTTIRSGFLTKDEFVNIHGRCGDHLHASNPYSATADKALDYPAIRNEFLEWDSKISRLLSSHWTQLVDSKIKLWVVMNPEWDDRVQVYEMEQIT